MVRKVPPSALYLPAEGGLLAERKALIAERDARIAELEARTAALDARLAQSTQLFKAALLRWVLKAAGEEAQPAGELGPQTGRAGAEGNQLAPRAWRSPMSECLTSPTLATAAAGISKTQSRWTAQSPAGSSICAGAKAPGPTATGDLRPLVVRSSPPHAHPSRRRDPQRTCRPIPRRGGSRLSFGTWDRAEERVVGLADRLPAPTIRWIGRQLWSRPYLGPPIRLIARRLRNQPRVVAYGQAKGLRINPSGAHPGYALGTTEPEIQDIFAAQVKPGSVVWDIGANVGFYTVIASRLVGTGQVIAFEPLPSSCAAIEQNLKLNGMTNVEIVGIAVSDEIGTATLNVYGGSTTARLGTRESSKVGRTPLYQIEVPVSTIDAQLEAFPAPALVKMDIEGAEAPALRGATALLTQVKPTLICELHGTNAPVMDVLDSCGYRVTTVGTPEIAPRDANWWGAHILATPT